MESNTWQKGRHLKGPICKAKNIDGKQYICDQDGNKLPYQIMTRVTDEYDKIPFALVKLFVEIE